MYATIRRYSLGGALDRNEIEGLRQRLETGFLPQVQEVKGFHAYYAVNLGDKELVTVGIFEDKSGGAESTRRAAEFVKTDPIRERLGSPDVVEGELLVSKEAAVPA